MKIGIYDSGIGGLSVLHRALKKMPEAEFIYYADTKHVPYGEKTRDKAGANKRGRVPDEWNTFLFLNI